MIIIIVIHRGRIRARLTNIFVFSRLGRSQQHARETFFMHIGQGTMIITSTQRSCTRDFTNIFIIRILSSGISHLHATTSPERDNRNDNDVYVRGNRRALYPVTVIIILHNYHPRRCGLPFASPSDPTTVPTSTWTGGGIQPHGLTCLRGRRS